MITEKDLADLRVNITGEKFERARTIVKEVLTRRETPEEEEKLKRLLAGTSLELAAHFFPTSFQR